MNILYLCDEYPPGPHGGIGTAIRLLAREMVKQEHRVVVAGLYSLGYGGEDEFVDEGVKVYRFRMGWDSKWFADEQSIIARVGKRILKDTGLMERDIKKSLSLYQVKLEKLIAGHRIDLVEMPDYNDYVRFCTSFVPFPKLSVPVIVKLHGSLTYFTREANRKVAQHIFAIEKAILTQAAAVSAVSQYTAKKNAAYFNYPKPIQVLYNGINTNASIAVQPKNPHLVIFTGTLNEKKGIYQLAKAWNIVNQQVPDACLLIFGKGDSRKVISHLNENARNTVSFMGHVPVDKLYEYLAESVISVFPSYAEAFALAPLEAMICGSAVINSNRTSGSELIDDQLNGILIDPDDTQQIASAILYLLNNPDAGEKLAKNGFQKVKECFGISRIAMQNLDFYNKVLTAANA
jgi:glycosyltransferase involved in cell wall biosynthesis